LSPAATDSDALYATGSNLAAVRVKRSKFMASRKRKSLLDEYGIALSYGKDVYLGRHNRSMAVFVQIKLLIFP